MYDFSDNITTLNGSSSTSSSSDEGEEGTADGPRATNSKKKVCIEVHVAALPASMIVT